MYIYKNCVFSFASRSARRCDCNAMQCNATGDHVTEFSTKSSRRRCRRVATSGGCTAGICLGEEWIACHSVFWGVLLSLVSYAMASGLHNFGAAQRIEDAERQRTQVVLREGSARVGTMRRANVGWPASFPQFKISIPKLLTKYSGSSATRRGPAPRPSDRYCKSYWSASNMEQRQGKPGSSSHGYFDSHTCTRILVLVSLSLSLSLLQKKKK